jgi:hypothetical protein
MNHFTLALLVVGVLAFAVPTGLFTTTGWATTMLDEPGAATAYCIATAAFGILAANLWFEEQSAWTLFTTASFALMLSLWAGDAIHTRLE